MFLLILPVLDRLGSPLGRFALSPIGLERTIFTFFGSRGFKGQVGTLVAPIIIPMKDC